MSKLSRAIRYQRRQKAEKRRLHMEKKMNKCVMFSDAEPECETDEGITRKTFTIESIPEIIYEEDQIDESLDQTMDSIMRQIDTKRNEGWIFEEIIDYEIHFEPINKN